jgi:hypothetical protein
VPVPQSVHEEAPAVVEKRPGSHMEQNVVPCEAKGGGGGGG